MGARRASILNPYSYERIDNERFFIGSHLAGHIQGSVDTGFVWRSPYGYQAYDADLKRAVRRMRNIYWYRTLTGGE